VNQRLHKTELIQLHLVLYK